MNTVNTACFDVCSAVPAGNKNLNAMQQAIRMFSVTGSSEANTSSAEYSSGDVIAGLLPITYPSGVNTSYTEYDLVENMLIEWPKQLLEEPSLELAPQWSAWWNHINLKRLLAVEKYYTLVNAQVRAFLWEHLHLIDVLLEALPYIKACFGQQVKVILRTVREPDAHDSKELFAYIDSPLPVDEALACLDRLDEVWFLDQLERVDGIFNFTLELA